ncbi:MAG: hypothetical protein KAU21_16150, partial [Gammaproteobacteria bacterium]|nr:hypothetical protein [Gammaproteobacteria bacterium]
HPWSRTYSHPWLRHSRQLLLHYPYYGTSVYQSVSQNNKTMVLVLEQNLNTLNSYEVTKIFAKGEG